MMARSTFAHLRQPSKYNVDNGKLGRLARTCHHCGRVFDSVREVQYHWWLLAEEQAGRVTRHTCQYRIYLEWPDGTRIRPYDGKRDSALDIDFRVEFVDGTTELHECKGYVSDKDPVTRLWRLKLGIVARMHPDWPIKIVK